jgi:hypothetical protein
VISFEDAQTRCSKTNAFVLFNVYGIVCISISALRNSCCCLPPEINYRSVSIAVISTYDRPGLGFLILFRKQCRQTCILQQAGAWYTHVTRTPTFLPYSSRTTYEQNKSLSNTTNSCDNWRRLIFFGTRNDDSALGPMRENSVETRAFRTNCALALGSGIENNNVF